MATFKAPNDGEEHGQKVRVTGEESKDEFADEPISKHLKDVKSLRVEGAKGIEIDFGEGGRGPF